MLRKFPFLLFLIFLPAALAHGDTEEIVEIVGNKVPCSQLSEEQLVLIGEYLVEQMQPGEDHLAFEKQYGGDNSETLRKEYLKVAEEQYCLKSTTLPYWLFGVIFLGLVVIAYLVFKN